MCFESKLPFRWPNLIEQRTAEYRMSNRRMSKGGFALLSPFNKMDRYIPSTFDIHYSFFMLV